ncbi:substrate-binding domain-containing protein [Algirhabdus cladophorae]|uniref:LacI family DNA-binding transcriptional regulator n=1 Tax=Algirhabdus cladophorae TaxID=3377108 RepID=UPI003B845948
MKTSKNQSDKVDIIAVAKAAAVSPSTVSRTFNHPDLVKPSTRKKIEGAVKKLGYIRNRAAQAMHGKRSGTIGLIVPTVNNTIFAELIQSFSDAVDAAGFTLLMASHGYDLDREYAVLRKFLEHRVDGVALIGLTHADETLGLVTQQQVPMLTLWNYGAETDVSCIGASNHDAGAMAAQHLLAQGHRKIGLVFPPLHGNDRAGDRQAGALQALTQAGCAPREDWVFQAPYSLAHAKRVCIDVLAQTDRPTALLCSNDVIAQGAIYAAHVAGLNVPQDLSVIGIGDFRGSAEMEPALTTIRLPADEIGTRAGHHLAALISGDLDGPIRDKCDVALMLRATTHPV